VKDEESKLSRRNFLGAGARAAAPPWAASALGSGRQYRDAALRAGKWIDSFEIHRGINTVWPVSPGASVSFDLYSGIAGVVLFQLALGRAGSSDALTRAMAGANALIEHICSGKSESGLYVGLAGIAWTLEAVYEQSRVFAYRDHAKLAAKTLLDALPDETDIVYGLAGTGFALLRLSERCGDPALLDGAVSCGERLLDRAQETSDGGVRWLMRSVDEVEMPGFSHGTAGVVAFLATLYRVTGSERFLSAASAGGRHLIAMSKGDDCMIPRKPTERIFYSGWCHGPVGTARAFHALNAAEGGRWSDWVVKCARSVWKGKGFDDWNNFGLCCGVAGKAAFFLDLYLVSRSQKWLVAAIRLGEKLIKRAVMGDDELYWPHAEHRLKQSEVVAQTGLMQGASGIGLTLLQLDAALNGENIVGYLPDNPFLNLSNITPE
jgi:lantibiotic modifying enzyme